MANSLPTSFYSPPTLLRSDSQHYSTSHKKRAESHKYDTILKWKSKPKNCLIVKKIKSVQCTHDFIEISLYLLNEKKVNLYIEDTSKEDLKELAETKDVKAKDIQSKAQEIIAHKNVKMANKDKIGEGVQLIVVLGGDGTLLYLISLFRDHQQVPPIVAFQRGSLGFLEALDRLA